MKTPRTGQFYPNCSATEHACWAPVPLSEEARCSANSFRCDILTGEIVYIDCTFGDDEWNCVSDAECQSDPDSWFICENSPSNEYLDTTDTRPICIPAAWSCRGGDTGADCPNGEDVSQEFCCGNPGYDGMYKKQNIMLYIIKPVHIINDRQTNIMFHKCMYYNNKKSN